MSAKLITGLAIALVIGMIWLRSQWGRSKNKNASRQIIADLQSGKHVIESYSDALSIVIYSKPIDHEIRVEEVKEYLNMLPGKKLPGRYSVQYGDMNKDYKGIVIGEGFVTDTVHDRQMDVFYPCWLYIDADKSPGTITFRSTFPENKDHHELLEGLSEEIFKQCINNNS